MLYTIVLLVCLAGAPQSCETREETVQELASHPGTAFVQAQALVAEWSEAHPRYHVKSWRLRSGRGA